jgi:hypothetical protein
MIRWLSICLLPLLNLAVSINRRFGRAMLTPLSNVTHNPASHKSEAGVIYCRNESLRQSAGAVTNPSKHDRENYKSRFLLAGFICCLAAS